MLTDTWRKCYRDTYDHMLQIWEIRSTNMQITTARKTKGVDAKRVCPWAVWELFWDPSSPPWVFCLSREGCSLFCGGRFSSRINEKLHLSHEKSIFTIYLTSCIPKAHIRRCWLMLAYSSVFWCIHCHCCDLLWVGCPPSSRAHWVSCISHVHCQKSHSSALRWNMVHNWKSEGVIEEMRVIKLPRTSAFFLDNVFFFIWRWMIVHRKRGFTGTQYGISQFSQTFRSNSTLWTCWEWG